MIKLYKYLDEDDFKNEFRGLDNTDWADEWQALGVLYYWIDEEEDNFSNVRDWLRFQVMEMTADEIKENYSIDFERYPEVEDFLNYYTMLYGTYESNGTTYYLFSEF